MKDTLFIINPASARGTTRQRWAATRSELLDLGLEFTERETNCAGEATDITREALMKDVTRIIAVGGDGTLSEVVNGYIDDTGRPLEKDAAVGILPSGTGSDFCRSIGLRSRSQAIASVSGQNTRLIDAARIDYSDKEGMTISRSFINVASFGLGGDVSALVNQWRDKLPRWIGGRVRFAAAAIRALEIYRNSPVRLQLDHGQIDVLSNLIVIANGRFGGAGMNLAPHAELDDGLLDVIITDRATRFDVIRELPRIRRGGYLKNPKVTETRSRQVSVTADQPMAIDIDGDMVGFTPAKITVLPKAVRFLIASEVGDRK